MLNIAKASVDTGCCCADWNEEVGNGFAGLLVCAMGAAAAAAGVEL